MVAAHGVNAYSHTLCLHNADDLPALVRAAISAHPVRQGGMIALGAKHGLYGCERMVGTPFAFPGLRCSAFWNWHLFISNTVLLMAMWARLTIIRRSAPQKEGKILLTLNKYVKQK
jgi:hypothetical protein